jgi:hypothetical protein
LGLLNTIFVPLSPSGGEGEGGGGLPEFLKGLKVPAEFPAPNPRPKVLQNITIRDMKLKSTGAGTGGFLASGIVEGRIVFPKGMEIGLDVSRILPDVLIFDGEVPLVEDGGLDEDEEVYVDVDLDSVSTHSWWNRKHSWKWWREHRHKSEHEHKHDSKDDYDYTLPNLPWSPSKHKKNPPPPRDPLPDPLPERAFGHIRPEEWLNAKSVHVDLDEDEDDSEDSDDVEDAGSGVGKRDGKEKERKEKETGAVYAVTAKVVDVPLEVLPGRQKEFSNFVSKVRLCFFNPSFFRSPFPYSQTPRLTNDRLTCRSYGTQTAP